MSEYIQIFTIDASETLIIPSDLKQALEANTTAKDYFEGFNNSSKKNILFWIDNVQKQD